MKFGFNVYGSRLPTQVPLLNAWHHLQHLSWAHDNISWTLDDWKTVAWSDEPWFWLVRASGRLWMWHRPQKPNGHKLLTRHCASWWWLHNNMGCSHMEWTGSSGQTEWIYNQKWLCWATWKLFAPIHVLHIPKQQWNFYGWQCVMSLCQNFMRLVWRACSSNWFGYPDHLTWIPLSLYGT